MAQETLSWKKKVWKCVQKIPLRSGAYKGCGRESWKLQLKFRNDDVGMRPSCRTQLWPFRPAWWVGHGLGSTVLIFLPPLSFPLPPSLPPFLLEIRALRCPLNERGRGFRTVYNVSLSSSCGEPCLVVQVSLIPGRKWSSCFHLPRSWACKPTRCCMWFTKGLWGNWVCVLAVLDWSHSLDLLCTSYLFLKSIFSPLIIWNKVWSQETHQRSPKQGSHHPA